MYQQVQCSDQATQELLRNAICAGDPARISRNSPKYLPNTRIRIWYCDCSSSSGILSFTFGVVGLCQVPTERGWIVRNGHSIAAIHSWFQVSEYPFSLWV